MKGYITKQGRVVLVEKDNGCAVVNISLLNGNAVEIMMSIDRAKNIHLADLPNLFALVK